MIGGLLLAAGGARRFGAPKQLAELDGRPLVQHALDALLCVPALDPVVVVLGAHAEQVADALDPGPAEIVVCPDWEEGISASLRCGVVALEGCERVLITLADQPLITAQVIAMLLDRSEGVAAARATYDGVPGHPVVLGRSMLRRVGELRGDRGFADLLAGSRARMVEAGHLCSPRDVDTPEDLEALKA